MRQSDTAEFARLLGGVFALYSKELSQTLIGIWIAALQPYELAAVRDAFNRHAVNPDNGQWLPKPADIVKLIDGGTQDAALVAWAAVDRAVRSIGAYQSVVFDDPIVHAVLADMGGWIELCKMTDHEHPFKAKEFVTRYRGFKLRAGIISYPKSLPGITEATNGFNGFESDPPVLIGDPEKAAQIYSAGTSAPRLQMSIGKLLAAPRKDTL